VKAAYRFESCALRSAAAASMGFANDGGAQICDA
jgi:hypothetical protein